MHQDATWYGCRPQTRGLCVRWRPTLPPQKVGGAAQIFAHVYCGQAAGWIKTALGMEVGIGPVHIVLDGDTAPLPQKNFGPSLLWPNGWMHQDGTWHGGRPWSSPHCARCGHSSPPQKTGQSPNFRPIFTVAKRLHASRCHLVRR